MILQIAIPEYIILSARRTDKAFEIEAKRAIALKFYVDEIISLGQAAELAEMTKDEFMIYLGTNKISMFRYETENEILNDIEMAGKYVNE